VKKQPGDLLSGTPSSYSDDLNKLSSMPSDLRHGLGKLVGICRYSGLSVTDALELAGDRSFWRQIATAGCYGWSLRAMMMMMMKIFWGARANDVTCGVLEAVREMTSWPPSWKYAVIFKIRFRQSMCMHSTNCTFLPNFTPIEFYRRSLRRFWKRSPRQEEQDE